MTRVCSHMIEWASMLAPDSSRVPDFSTQPLPTDSGFRRKMPLVLM